MAQTLSQAQQLQVETQARREAGGSATVSEGGGVPWEVGGAGHTDCVEGRPYKIMHKRTLGRLQVGNAQSRRNYKAHKAQRGSSEGRSKR